MLPASAGMILRLVYLFQQYLCAPRIRGDDPIIKSPKPLLAQCSPHPRG